VQSIERADLLSEAFDPRLTQHDLAFYQGKGPIPDDVRREQERIERADFVSAASGAVGLLSESRSAACLAKDQSPLPGFFLRACRALRRAGSYRLHWRGESRRPHCVPQTDHKHVGDDQ
jgi:hypothetical protein